jgi:hypothetical protein
LLLRNVNMWTKYGCCFWVEFDVREICECSDEREVREAFT